MNKQKPKESGKPIQQKKTVKDKPFNYFNKWKIIFGVVFLFTFLLFANTLHHDFCMDDTIAVSNNKLVQKGLDGIPEILSKGFFFGNTGRNDESYRPFSTVVFAIEKSVFGNKAHVYHFFNVLYFSLGIVLLCWLLLRIFKNYSYWIPIVITLLFASHPIHTEVVANIKSRDEIFLLVLSMLSLNLLWSYLERGKIWLLLMSLLSLFLACLSKEVALTFVAIIPIFLWFFSDIKTKRIVLISSSYILPIASYLFLRNTILDSFTFDHNLGAFENTLLAAQNKLEQITTNIAIHGKYLFLQLFPYKQSWDYTFNEVPVRGFFDIWVILSFIVLLGSFIWAILNIRKKDPVSFGILFYVITISITSNFIVIIACTMAERFVFLPSLGFVICVVFLLLRIFKVQNDNITKNKPFIYSFFIILVLFSFRTIIRNNDWKNDVSLIDSGILTSPNSARTHMNMGNVYVEKFKQGTESFQKQNDFNSAKHEYDISKSILDVNSDLYYNYGNLYYLNKMKKEALEALKKSIQQNKRNVSSLIYAGLVSIDLNNHSDAKNYLENALKYDPKNINALNNLGFMYYQLKDYENVIKTNKRILIIDPKNYKTWTNLGFIYNLIGKTTEAIEAFQQAIKIDPKNKNAYAEIIKLYEKLGNTEMVTFYKKFL